MSDRHGYMARLQPPYTAAEQALLAEQTAKQTQAANALFAMVYTLRQQRLRGMLKLDPTRVSPAVREALAQIGIPADQSDYVVPIGERVRDWLAEPPTPLGRETRHALLGCLFLLADELAEQGVDTTRRLAALRGVHIPPDGTPS